MRRDRLLFAHSVPDGDHFGPLTLSFLPSPHPSLIRCTLLCLNQSAQCEVGTPTASHGPFLLWAAMFLRPGAGIPRGSRTWGKSRLLVGVSLAVPLA